jgi:hypothetical protein
MPCYHPLKGYRSKDRNPTGKRSIVFSSSEGFRDLPVELPCGQCIGCRLEKSRQWAIRCVHEAKLHADNCFLTLTYREETLPENGTLVLEHFQLFMKRLRKSLPKKKIRFFHCGEYGDKFDRPHYHSLIFGHDFSDKTPTEKTKTGEQLYESKTLDQLWGHGLCRIGDVTFESAAYVARYITKKLNGKMAAEYGDKKPEYATMSRNSGIGKEYFEKYKSDFYPSDEVILLRNGSSIKCKPPKAYDTYLETLSSREMAIVKAQREVKAELHKENCTPERLRVREEVQLERFDKLKRSYDSDQ